MVCLLYLPCGTVWRLVSNLQDLLESPGVPSEVHAAMARYIVGRAHWEIQRICTADCRRVSSGVHEAGEAEIRPFWQRFREPSARVAPEASDVPDGFVIIEESAVPCSAGLLLDADHQCPLVAVDDEHLFSEQCLAALQEVLLRRVQLIGDQQLDQSCPASPS
jgi:hypothetical protein